MTDDEDDVMPPVDSHLSLNNKKELLQRWIAEGAVYDTHWSLKLIKTATQS